MKTTKKITVVLLVLIATAVTTGINAQQGKRMTGRGFCAIPDLTGEQQDQLIELRASHQKEMFKLQSDMRNNRDEYKLLLTDDNVDKKALEKNLDENARIHKEMMQEKADFHTAVRQLLTDEQKKYFDMRLMNRHGYRGHQGKNKPMCLR
jgi:Spy/CpxP family protein refolding chaperone